MFTPERMDQIQVVFSKQDLDLVADVIVQHGSLQMIDAAQMEGWASHLAKGGSGEPSHEMKTRQERVERILRDLNLKTITPDPVRINDTWDTIDKKIGDIERNVHDIIIRQDDKKKDKARLEELKQKMGELPQLGFPLESQSSYSYLAVETGRIAEDNMPLLQNQLASVVHVLYPISTFNYETTILVVVLRRDKDKLGAALRESGFKRLDFSSESQPVSPELLKDLDRKIDTMNQEIQELEENLFQITREQQAFLQAVYYQIRAGIIKQQMLQFLRKTDNMVLLSGWIPASRTGSFKTAVRKATQNRCIIEETAAEDLDGVRNGKVEVPVRFKNPTLLRPFELITGSYGIPAYRTLDPTPVLGISFILMFGMMFGDVGHGLILAVLGLFLLLKNHTDFQKNAGILICYVGASSMVFGFLFGSLFGFDRLSWLPPLWLRPMESISELFRVTLYFGMVMIFMSIAINIINAIRLRKFWDALFDKAGLLAAILYWSGIVMASRVVSESPGIKSHLYLISPVLMTAALVLLFFREPIVHLIQGKKKLYPEGILTGVISGLMELVEIVLGFLANTVSFIRVAAFGLVHAGLAMAIFALSESLGGVGSVLVIIGGNVLIILLEGLVVSIQAVRLEFYEFFSRFFKEGKVGYRPVRIE